MWWKHGGHLLHSCHNKLLLLPGAFNITKEEDLRMTASDNKNTMRIISCWIRFDFFLIGGSPGGFTSINSFCRDRRCICTRGFLPGIVNSFTNPVDLFFGQEIRGIIIDRSIPGRAKMSIAETTIRSQLDISSSAIQISAKNMRHPREPYSDRGLPHLLRPKQAGHRSRRIRCARPDLRGLLSSSFDSAGWLGVASRDASECVVSSIREASASG